MNCHTCKYKGSVAGSAHICCQHPIFEIPELKSVMMLQLSAGRLYTNPSRILLNKEPAQDFNPVGLKNGWVLFPFNFDPTWLNKCLFYLNKESNEDTDNLRDT